MYLIVVGWSYVALMMTLVEATSSTGSVLGAIVTLLFYGVVPVSLILYFISRRGRRRLATPPVGDAGQHPSAGPETGRVAPVREEA